MRYLFLAVLAGCVVFRLGAEETLYPFLRGEKWGYINASGVWVIEPQFDRCIEMLEKERVRVWQGSRWGYIDRSGKWIVQPRYTEPCLGDESAAFEIVSIGKKQGILSHSGKLVLPVKYDGIAMLDDSAWVRSGEKIGLFALDGHWLLKPSMDWPYGREMPTPTKGGVSWFKRGKKWGLFSRDGKVLFEPQFAEHVMGRKESEEWNHPEGLDFKNGRAWVTVRKEFWLITDEGKVLCRQSFGSVHPWTNELYVFENSEVKKGLISTEGEIKLAARFCEINQPSEGFAVVAEERSRKEPDGKTDVWRVDGYIDEHGKVIIEPGAYEWSAVRPPFSEELAPVWNSPPGHTYDPYAGYIDHTGALVIPEQFYSTEPFSEGFGAFAERAPLGKGLSPKRGRSGYVDRTGAIAIPPQFGGAAPFCRDRAWVSKAYGDWNHPQFAMIDRTGKVLTDYAFDLPERRTNWIGKEFFGGGNSDGKYSAAEWLRKTRWRGDLAVISRGDFHNGLATADGKILVEPIFNSINEFHDGVAVAVDSRGRDEKGDVKFVTALITERGEILATDTYTAISDFDHGVGWASHRWTDHRGPYRHEGWGLIDTSSREICELKYVGAHWVWERDYSYTDNMCPKFYGELAPVTLADGFQQYGEKVWLLNSWGYMSRDGKIVVWHNKQASK